MNIRIFDKKGKTVDRYSVYIPYDWHNEYALITMSTNPLHPKGVNQYSHDVVEIQDDGKEVTLNELPHEVQLAILKRMG